MKYNLNLSLGLAVVAAGLLFPAGRLQAQEGRDFLFGKPRVTLSLNMGYGLARANSGIFEEIDTLYTLGKSDFNAPGVNARLAVMLNERIDLAFELGYSRSEAWSEYVDWGEDLGNGERLPIEHKTGLSRVPASASLRYFFNDRGREISRFAWVPSKINPYVGAGVGRVYYSYEESGDFINFSDPSSDCQTYQACPIVSSEFTSDGTGWMTHVFGGAEFSLAAHFVLNVEGRYTWAEAEMDRTDFQGYGPIDLSGFQATAGIGVRF